MGSTVDISWTGLLISELMLAIPLFVFGYYRTRLVKPALFSVVRMTVQLFLVGIYLGYIFKLNNPWVNVAWVLVMLGVTCQTIARRGELKLHYFLLPFVVSIVFTLVIIDTFFLGFTVRIGYLLDARYFIPITGMLLGNIMQSNVIAANSFYHNLYRNKIAFRFALASGATQHEAVFPFIGEALKKAFNPTIAQMATIGLVSLPGMMTGQILGGNDPSVAIKYQIMMMIAIFTANVISVILCIRLSGRFIFDSYGNLREDIVRTGFITKQI
jgi:putative ABC transport system permease protein